MSVSAISSGSPAPYQPLNQAANQAAQSQSQHVKDADGDYDGDTTPETQATQASENTGTPAQGARLDLLA